MGGDPRFKAFYLEVQGRTDRRIPKDGSAEYTDHPVTHHQTGYGKDQPDWIAGKGGPDTPGRVRKEAKRHSRSNAIRTYSRTPVFFEAMPDDEPAHRQPVDPLEGADV